MADPRIVPLILIREVDSYVAGEMLDVEKYDNRELLDESGVYSLHRLAATLYACGYDDGERAEAARDDGRRTRQRDAERRAAEAAKPAEGDPRMWMSGLDSAAADLLLVPRELLLAYLDATARTRNLDGGRPDWETLHTARTAVSDFLTQTQQLKDTPA